MSRVVVVTRRTNIARYLEETHDPRVRWLLEHRDPVVKRWRRAHTEHMRTLDEVERVLARDGVHTVVIDNPHLAFDATDADLVITVGGDGTLLAASHNVGHAPILGVNSAPRSSVGFYCAGHADNVATLLPAALAGRARSVRVQRMQVTVDGSIRAERVLNEALYCHASPAATSKYIISVGRTREEHRSSGFWVGTAAGSTAAQRSAGGRILPLPSSSLQLVVREPYKAPGQRFDLVRTVVDPPGRITVKSKMQEACMFLDGPYMKIGLALGGSTVFSLSRQPLTVIGLSPRRARAR
ncbi:MAG: NAD(+)/NADH kinase [Polyangiaceae bacterium]|nr:NAD(+)/NADH kinase [Polyangiaceae bacterium]